MSLTRREVIMASTTGAVVLGLVSWLIASPMVKTIEKARTEKAKLQTEKNALEKLINQRVATMGQLEGLRAQLPRFHPDEQVSAQIVASVKKIANEQSLELPRLTPDTEKRIGDISELAIECSWEGTLESVSHFLHAVQVQGAMLDVRQLSAQPHPSTTKSGLLKGNFKLFYAFMRVKPEPVKPVAAPAATNAPTASTNAPVLKVSTNAAPAAVTNAPATTNKPATPPTPPMPPMPVPTR